MDNNELLGKVVRLHRESEPKKAKLYLINDKPTYYSGGTVNVEIVKEWIDRGLNLTFYNQD